MLKEPLPRHLLERQFTEFWRALEKDQEVRWTGAKAQTYFINGVQLYRRAPGLPFWMQTSGPYIILRRHTGKTFYAQLGTIRPLGWTKPERLVGRKPTTNSLKELLP